MKLLRTFLIIIVVVMQLLSKKIKRKKNNGDGISSSSSSSSKQMPNGSNGATNSIPEKIHTSIPDNTKLKSVFLTKRHIGNQIHHWAVLVELENTNWANIQFGGDGVFTHFFKTFNGAALSTWGEQDEVVRTKSYGDAKTNYTLKNLKEEADKIKNEHPDYNVITNNCHDFARRLIGSVSNDWVGSSPSTTGKVQIDAAV